MRETSDCYNLFRKYKSEFNTSKDFADFCQITKLSYLLDYVGGWVEQAYWTMKAGKETHRGLKLPNANRFSDLFTEVYLLPTDMNNKPEGVHFLGGDAGFTKHLGGTRGWSKTCEGARSQYGAKFYGTYVVPIESITYKNTSFEAITRTDGILITIQSHNYTGCDWIALLDLTEDIKTLYDDDTKAMLAKERQAEIDAWGYCKG